MPLFAFLDLIDQLDDVGRGTYAARDAFEYMALLLPRRFLELAPFIALLGNVIGLGRLAASNELNAMRAAGLSPARISMATLGAGLTLAACMLLMEQFVAAPLQQRALSHRAAALEQSTELGRDLGIWSRDANEVLRIGSVQGRRRAFDVSLLELDDDGFLRAYIHAASADIVSGGDWMLHDVTERRFDRERVDITRRGRMPWTPFLKPDQLSTLTKPAPSLAPLELYRLVGYLKGTGQQWDPYALALWRKLGGCLTAIAMMLLSVPFVFGSVRTGLGQRILFATVAGIAIYLLDQIIGNAGLLLHLNPAVVALAPGIVLIAVSRQWLRRVQ